MAHSGTFKSFTIVSATVVSLLVSANDPCAAAGDSLRLQDVLGLVVERSPVLRAADAATDQAHAQAWMASSFWDPVFALEAERGGTAGRGFGGWGSAYRASVVQRTQWGVEISPFVSHTQVGVSQTGIAMVPGATAVGLSVSLPLTRIGPRHPLGLTLGAARMRAVAADQEQAYTVAGELLRATLAYWELRGAQERLSVVQDAAERSADVRGIIARLVAAGERAAADEAQAAAFVADRLTDVAVARQDLWERAAVLGTACGVPAARFREAHLAQEMPAAALPTTRLRSVEARPDLAARRALLRAERIALRQRMVETLPDVALGGAVARPLDDTLPGSTRAPQVTVSLSLRSSVLRSQTRAAVAEQRARMRAQELALERAMLDARNRAEAANAAVNNALRELQAAEEAQRAHRRAVENERKRLAAGFATVFDVILAEDRLTSARLAVSAARMRLGQSVARHAFESGALGGESALSVADVSAKLLGYSNGSGR